MKERPILFSGPMVQAILAGRKTQTRRVVRTRHPLGFLGGRGQENDLSAWGWFFDGPEHHGYMVLARGLNERRDHGNISIPCPYGQPGDRLWVREAHYRFGHWEPVETRRTRSGRQKWRFVPHEDAGVLFEAPPAGFRKGRHHKDPSTPAWHKRLARFMPRALSRITLEVTEVRVQRIQEISEEDAKAEGVEAVTHESWTAYDPETDGYPSFGVKPDPEMIAQRRLENVRHHGPTVISTAKKQFRLLWDSINGERMGCSWEANPWTWCTSFRRLP